MLPTDGKNSSARRLVSSRQGGLVESLEGKHCLILSLPHRSYIFSVVINLGVVVV